MKNGLRYILQKMLGFQNYLFVFSIFTIKRLRYNSNEASFLHFLDIIPGEGIILDIGANIGNTVVPIARSRKRAQVFAFEPVAENLITLKRVIKYFKLKNVLVFETALGDYPGQLKMIMPVKNGARLQGLSHVYNESAQGKENGNIYNVDVVTLDSIPALNGNSRVGAIKIDVENYEYAVLKGGKNIIEKHRPVIYCELWMNQNRENVMNYLKDMDYEVKVFDGVELIDFTNEMSEDTMNFFFIPAGKS